MMWARFDSQMPHHAKVRRAGAEAAMLWVCGICYCNAHSTNGRIDKDMVPGLYLPLLRAAERLALKLCQVGLWADRGAFYEVHDYEQYQGDALKEEVTARREYERQRKRAQRDARSESGVELTGKIYFARAGDRIKIGFSKNPWARVDALRTGSPVPVILLGYIEADFSYERELHDRFAHLRDNLEWFRAEPELLEYIDKTATKSRATGSGTTKNGRNANGSEATHARPPERAGAPASDRPTDRPTAVAAATADFPVTSNDVAAAWHRATNLPGGHPGVLHAEHAWRADYETVAAAVNRLHHSERRQALTAVCEWFWVAPDGPVQSGRLSRYTATPEPFAKHISRDLAAAYAWWQALQGMRSEAAS